MNTEAQRDLSVSRKRLMVSRRETHLSRSSPSPSSLILRTDENSEPPPNLSLIVVISSSENENIVDIITLARDTSLWGLSTVRSRSIMNWVSGSSAMDVPAAETDGMPYFLRASTYPFALLFALLWMIAKSEGLSGPVRKGSVPIISFIRFAMNSSSEGPSCPLSRR